METLPLLSVSLSELVLFWSVFHFFSFLLPSFVSLSFSVLFLFFFAVGEGADVNKLVIVVDPPALFCFQGLSASFGGVSFCC